MIVFIRAPRPGTVKTRLATAIGPAAAADAYQTLVETVLDRIAPVGPVEIYYAPVEAVAEIRHWLRPGWRAHPQKAGDLGARMQAAFEDAFASGGKRVVLIGSDCPTVHSNDVEAAWAKLEDHDVVLGPATDGGYWLIALREPQSALFQKITWSTNTVLRETLNRAHDAGLRTFLLRELTDVDTETEWRTFSSGQRPR